MPALLRVVKSRLFLALRRKGKRKCRPSPQMRNGAYTTTPSADVSNAEHAPLIIPRSFYCRQARMYSIWGATAAVVPRWRHAVVRWTRW